MHWAAENGHTEVVRVLAENNADVNAKDSDEVKNCWRGLKKSVDSFKKFD